MQANLDGNNVELENQATTLTVSDLIRAEFVLSVTHPQELITLDQIKEDHGKHDERKRCQFYNGGTTLCPPL